jgi:hypothetical protein
MRAWGAGQVSEGASGIAKAWALTAAGLARATNWLLAHTFLARQ